MDEPLAPWWSTQLRGHPMAAAQGVDLGPRWVPTPVPALRIDNTPAGFSVSWALDQSDSGDLSVEVVGEHLVLRAVHEGRVVSRAVPIPEDVDLRLRRDRISHHTMEIMVPRTRPTSFGRVRHWLADALRGLATWLAPTDPET